MTRAPRAAHAAGRTATCIAAFIAALALAACASPVARDATPTSATAAATSTTTTAATAEAVTLLSAGIGERRLVLLGETHGTREIPALVGDLLARGAASAPPTVLALEIDEREQPGLERYLASRGTARDRAALLAGDHWRDPMHDGRDSAAMLALIERVRALHAGGRALSIVPFDPGMPDRDRRMAERLRALVRARPDARVIVLTGNVHAMTSAPPWEMLDEAGHRIEAPMAAGRHLADLRPLSIELDAAQGEAWNCLNGCRAHPLPDRGAQAVPSYARNPPGQSAWQATLRLPRFSASPPAIDALPEAASATP